MNKTVKNRKHKGLKIFALVMALVVIVITILGLVFIDNKNIDYERFELSGAAKNNGEIKVAHLSDLHFPKVKVDVESLVKKLSDESPDIIAITGDLIDDNAEFESCGVVEFLEKIENVARIFYVYGNHEMRNDENIAKLSNASELNGVTILENKSVNILIREIEITVIGLRDNADYDKKYLDENLNAKTNYKILLAHRPEKWDNYTLQEKEVQPNLILTGHVHGGQFRFFGQGLFGASQGLFPKYDSGSYKTEDENCTMIVSRGIGSSLLPFRFNNKPHVPIITIKL